MESQLVARRIRRRTFFFTAALLLSGLVVRYAISGFVWNDVRHVAWVQLAWAGSFVALGLGVGTEGMRPGLPGPLAGLVCVVYLTLLVLITGGPRSSYLVVLITVPLILSMFTPDTRVPTLVALVMMLGAVTLVHVLAGIPARTFLPDTLSYAFLGSIGLYAGRTYQRLREAERLAQQERLIALEQLAESERLRRRAESERAEMERLMMVGRLAAGVAHEVNNPLAFVKSNLHYLEQELTAGERPADVAELRELLDETRQGVLRIQRIITDLRHFSTDVDLSALESSPRAAMEEARRLALSRLHSRGEVVLDVTEELPPVRLGQQHLMQVLLNLLLNAAQAVEKADPWRPACILMRARTTARDVRMEVEDNGPGIPEELLPRLFDPFASSPGPASGHGLGLALCREYVVRVGGTLTAENRPEGGARFILTLHQASAAMS